MYLEKAKWFIVITVMIFLRIPAFPSVLPVFPSDLITKHQSATISITEGNDDQDQYLAKLNRSLQEYLTIGDTLKANQLIKVILQELKVTEYEELLKSDTYYLIGVYHLIGEHNLEALSWLRESLTIRKQLGKVDHTHAKCLYNTGLAFYKLGDFIRSVESGTEALNMDRKVFGEKDPILISSYNLLVSAYILMNDFNSALQNSNEALALIQFSDASQIRDISNLYVSTGVCYTGLANYSKALLYLEQSESLYLKYKFPEDENYVNLMNSLGVVYYLLGRYDESETYFNRGFRLIRNSGLPVSMTLFSSYSIKLADAGNKEDGRELILNSLDNIRMHYGSSSRTYFDALKNCAEYLRIYGIDTSEALRMYRECVGYAEKNRNDIALYNSIMHGYALSLNDNGDQSSALAILQELIFSDIPDVKSIPEFDDPDIDQIGANRYSINLFRAKYKVLRQLYVRSGNIKFLVAAARTAENVVNIIDRTRVSISEEDSRIILGDRYRESYLSPVIDYTLCYNLSGKTEFLEKAFEYSEKSKVAGLIASTRELKATQFHVPSEIADLEKKLKTEISYYEAKIYESNGSGRTATLMIDEWKSLVLKSTQKRDSLIRILEKQFPEYYSLKYNLQVINHGMIPTLAGRNTNFISYVMSDSVLYIFLKNRKYFKVAVVPVDSDFFKKISVFRACFSFPANKIQDDLRNYTDAGRILYEKLISPVEEFFISDNLLISPDNQLSYIPFEAIPYGKPGLPISQFRNIPYLMHQFRISYTYSATYLAESLSGGRSIKNRLLAFAPVYTSPIDIDSVIESRNAGRDSLHDLPFARSEARFVSGLTGGKLLINDAAKESAFKAEASKYDIIHLAMHTVLNDKNPMYSKMLFYQKDDLPDDGNLNTWEVYGTPLRAKMVILSSCNTGSGVLHSGEGIISLARGFLYSGSQSVIMSLWEIEDQSGTEIVKNYYKYLKRGLTKSDALRKARLEYLDSADVLRSHPYFWSSLVIYGNNDPLYIRPLYLWGASILILLIAGSVICYFLLRK